MLKASPVSPDVAMERALAPVLAVESPSPPAVASPVSPDDPEEACVPEAPPDGPEEPDTAVGLEPALDWAHPVFPVLVADVWARVSPELPEVAVGITVTFTLPPAPPLASARARDPPPTACPVAAPPAPTVMSVTEPPAPETADADPPRPPLPPTPVTFVTLTASPVFPETAEPWALAPVLAVELAVPVAWASPVCPEEPEVAWLPFTEPVAPPDPESAFGAEKAVEDAGPVSPVLVADERAEADPESPDVAVGARVT